MQCLSAASSSVSDDSYQVLVQVKSKCSNHLTCGPWWYAFTHTCPRHVSHTACVQTERTSTMSLSLGCRRGACTRWYVAYTMDAFKEKNADVISCMMKES